MFITTAAHCASDGTKSIGRLAAGVLFIYQPTKPAAIATGAGVATDATRPGKVASGKMENRFQQ